MDKGSQQEETDLEEEWPALPSLQDSEQALQKMFDKFSQRLLEDITVKLAVVVEEVATLMSSVQENANTGGDDEVLMFSEDITLDEVTHVVKALAGRSCNYKGKVYQDGEKYNANCLICFCEKGFMDCNQEVNCTGPKPTVVSSNFLEVKNEEAQLVFDSSTEHKLRKRSSGMNKGQGSEERKGKSSETNKSNTKQNYSKEPIVPATAPPDLNNQDGEGECVFNKDLLANGDSVNLPCSTCTCMSGAVSCITGSNCQGICSVTGSQIIRTFDGTVYESPGGCSYVLVKTESFSVYLNNRQCPDQNPDATCIDSVEIYIPSVTNVKILSNGKVMSSDEETILPFHINGHITVLRSSSVFLDVATKLGFYMQYDFLGSRIYIILDHQYQDHTRGLCGTFNNNRNDDFLSSSDMTETVASFFSKSWKMNQYCTERPSRNSDLDLDKQFEAEDTCDEALGNSIFADCQAVLDIQSYRENCVQSIYRTNSEAVLCSILEDYAYQCAQEGLSVSFHASFPQCDFGCVGHQVLATESGFTQADCREYSDDLLKIPTSVMLVEACICPSSMYYDATQDICVDGDLCPCYSQNQAYKLGQSMKFSNGKECPCERTMTCSDEATPEPEVPETCGQDEEFSDCLKGNGKACEPSCQSLYMTDQLCPFECQSGCICKYGYFRNIDGSCVSINQCPCFHGDDVYRPGDTISQDCKTCTCTEGKFICTKKACSLLCDVYGVSQYLLFDSIWKTFPTTDCEVVLSESQAGVSPAFRVSAVSRRSAEMGGALTTKMVTIHFGGTHVVLMDSDAKVTYDDPSSAKNDVSISHSGFFTVVELSGLSVYYDQKLDIFLQIEPQLQGLVQGMCGDADGKTSSEDAMSSTMQYAQQFVTGEVSGHLLYIEARCSLLKSEVFFPCHNQVSVESYYTACVEETKDCREGDSCLCFCTSVAAYARACCRKGVSIDWRKPGVCSAPCEYYNRDTGEGPFRIVTMDQLTLITDYNSKSVGFSKNDSEGELVASFMVTQSLFKEPSSNMLISLESVAHPNYFLVQNEDGTVRLDKWQSSVSFRKQASFFKRKNHWIPGYDALESFTSRQHYLSVGQGNSLVVARFIVGNTQAMSFKLIEETFGLPSFSMSTWKYKACESPCFPTCQDPYVKKCTLSVNVEGCFPHCSPGLVFDEVTHRCVHYEDCEYQFDLYRHFSLSVSLSLSWSLAQQVPGLCNKPLPCKNIVCPSTSCQQKDAIRIKIKSDNPCCEAYKCECPQCQPAKICKDGTKPTFSIDLETECCPTYTCPNKASPPTVKDAIRVKVKSDNPCCEAYECECPPCKPAPACKDGTKPTQKIDPETECCPVYTCPHEAAPPTSKDAVRVKVKSDNPCCEAYECECPSCPPAPACKDGTKPIKKIDPETECCPTYTCLCSACPSIPDCDPGFILRKDYDPETECCPTYQCASSPIPDDQAANKAEELANYFKNKIANLIASRTVNLDLRPRYSSSMSLPRTTFLESFEPTSSLEIENVLKKIKPASHPMDVIPTNLLITIPEAIGKPTAEIINCSLSQGLVPDPLKLAILKPLLKKTNLSPDDPANFRPIANLPFISKILERIVNKQLSEFLDNNKLLSPSQFGFLPEYPPQRMVSVSLSTHSSVWVRARSSSVFTFSFSSSFPDCPPCPSVPECAPGFIVQKDYDPATECCPTYKCVPENPTLPNECKDVTCPMSESCTKTDSIQVEMSGSDPCCPDYDCDCPPCPSVAECAPGFIVRKDYDPETNCCPSYKCVPENPALPNECKDVTCPLSESCTKTDSIQVEMSGSDPCCPDYDCACPDCQPPPICKDGSAPTQRFDPESECCPTYTCPNAGPPPTVPTSCTDVVCPSSSCQQKDAISVKVESNNPCCEAYKCVCSACPSVPDCDPGFIVRKDYDPETECCPKYQCVPEYPPQIPGTRAFLPKECMDVTCPLSESCSMRDSIQVEMSGSDPCCPNYDCECPPCPSVPECAPGLIVRKDYDPATECCPSYKCVPENPTLPNECKDVTCPLSESCTKTDSIQVEMSGSDPCCPDYDCDCPPCPSVAECAPGFIVWKDYDPETNCCPSYKCVPENPTLPNECKDVTCPLSESCTKTDSIQVEMSGSDPCCPDYDCACPDCQPPPICKDGSAPTQRFDPESECCPTYTCPNAGPPPTVPTSCTDVVCPSSSCQQKDAISVMVESNNPCCEAYKCVCSACPSVPDCDPGFIVRKDYDPETECCPKYQCVPEYPPQIPGTRAFLPKECMDVTCPLSESCSMRDSIQVEMSGSDPCCPNYDCECPPCPSVPECAPGLIVRKDYDPATECCPSYKCVPENPTLPNECKDVTCPLSESCTKTDSIQVEMSGSDPCCPDYDCDCPPCPSVAECAPGFIVWKDYDPETNCCPSYKCVPENPTLPNECKDVTCPLSESCTKTDSIQVEMSGSDPCCPDYDCDCPPCPSVPECAPGLIVRKDFDPEAECCPSYKCACPDCQPPPICKDGSAPTQRFDPESECCPTYTCPNAGPPPIVPSSCTDVVCPSSSCQQKDAISVMVESNNPCCEAYKCVCSACPSIPDCGPGLILRKDYDPETECCPTYQCAPENPTLPNECKDVTCPLSESCTKTDSIQVEMSGSDPCCPDYDCDCPSCPNVPECAPGFIVRKDYDPETNCCPSYKCVPENPTLPNECKDVTCPMSESCTKTDSIQVEMSGSDPCCPDYDCACPDCQPPPICKDGSAPTQRLDPESECCPTYTCPNAGPPPTVPSSCTDVVCPSSSCQQKDAISVMVESNNPCCEAYKCVCSACPSIPDCGPGLILRKDYDPETECCPTYQCAPENPTLPNECKDVTCPMSESCTKTDSIQVEMSGSDPCCPDYDCDCPSCPNVPECAPGFIVRKDYDPETNCCPSYKCVPENPTLPNECKDVTCPMSESCTKTDSIQVEMSGSDPCCPDYDCACPDCQPPPICKDGSAPTQRLDPESECCPTYTCPNAGPPPTVPSSCTDVVCPSSSCQQKDAISVMVESNNPCCEAYKCVCSACPSIPDCGPGLILRKDYDPETECCPTYQCAPENPTLPNECKDVTCPMSESCTKTDSIQVEMSGSDPCCPDYDCDCPSCPNVPECAPGFIVRKDYDPETNCCPSYKCVPENPTLPNECKDVTCPMSESCTKTDSIQVEMSGSDQMIIVFCSISAPENPTLPNECKDVTCPMSESCTKTDSIQVEMSGSDPCCPDYDCDCPSCPNVPECAPGFIVRKDYDPETNCCPSYKCVPENPTLPNECKDVTCPMSESCTKTDSIQVEMSGSDPCCPDYDCACPDCQPPPICKDGSAPTQRLDPESECCPTYTCPNAGPPPTVPSSCTDVVCPSSSCQQKDAISVMVESNNPCCEAYKCVCSACPSIPDCGPGLILRKDYDPETECCPTYQCAPENPTLPNECKDVTCPLSESCTKTDSIQVEMSGSDPCCPDYDCDCPSCPNVPECAPGFIVRKDYDPETNCCPSYKCVPENPTLPNECKDVTCPMSESCTKTDSIQVEMSGSDPCCPDYDCACPDCQPPPICKDGSAPTQRLDPESECCPTYTCPNAGPPPTVPSSCTDVVCPSSSCQQKDAISVMVESNNPCCEAYKCVCSACPSIPDCGPGLILRKDYDPETECCPTYQCAPENPTLPNECKDVTCPMSESCTKTDSIQVEMSGSDPCCPDYDCACPDCQPPPICKDGSAPTQRFDPESECCPTYTCPNAGPPPLVPGCQNATCLQTKECPFGKNLVKRPNPFDACCPLLDCKCSCDSVPACNSDERLVPVPQEDQCCPELRCERKNDECSPVYQEVQLTNGPCMATVKVAVCGGYCHSKSRYNAFWKLEPQCRCCSAITTRSTDFEVPCPNDTHIQLSVEEAVSCSCEPCSEDGTHSRRG
ncbi:uncharacterized protein LOC115080300 [Rhinatrema bivittatum]|uniref:uncharacterized protein LOC115080300 n=1 Tax=Rhinatrema bivittatum TaxID=194408 RepID=UPI001125D6F2|nr:uncharacterized protein LOC115080300 [Rhinatrema bivittatum]